MSEERLLTCRLCGQEHRAVALAPGERAHCTRCDAVLASGTRFGPDAALAFTVTALILAPLSALLPFVSADKLGSENVSLLFTGVAHVWKAMPLLAVWVLLCGGLIPVALLVTLAGLVIPARLGSAMREGKPLLRRAFHLLGHWAMPEVQVLAVLVALVKLGGLVTVTIGPGFWCYAAMSLALLVALRSFDIESASPLPSPARPSAPAP